MDFCSILKLAGVDAGNVSNRVKIWKILLLEVFLLVGFFNQTLSINVKEGSDCVQGILISH